jgi:Dehydratase medium subunit
VPNMQPKEQEAQPLVPILVMGKVTTQVLQAIQWGLEEEEIPADASSVPTGAVNTVAKQAAQMSKLNVGIAISQKEMAAVLHHRDLPVDRPLFVEEISRIDGGALRRLGANAARLVKGNPLLFPEEVPAAPQAGSPAPELATDAIAQVVAQVVREVIKQNKSPES